MKNKWIKFVNKLIVCVFCIIAAILIDINCFSYYEHIVFTLNDFNLFGLNLQEDGSVITSNYDSNINLDLSDPVFVQNIELTLEEALETEWRLQIFYADAFSEYAEDDSVNILVPPGQKCIMVSVKKTFSRLRCDLGDATNVVFKIKNVQINPAHGLLAINSIVPWLRIAILSILVLICGSLAHKGYELCKKKRLLETIKTRRFYRLICVGVLCSLFSVVFYMVFVQPYKSSKEEQTITLLPQEFTLIGMQADPENNTVTSMDVDPIMITNIPDLYVKDIRIEFNEAPGFDWTLQVFYTQKDDEQFSANHTAIKAITGDTAAAQISVNEKIAKLRLDLGDEPDRSFSIKRIRINPDDTIFTVNSIPAAIWILLIAICFLLTYFIIAHVYKVYSEETVTPAKTNRATVLCVVFIYFVIALAILLSADNMQKSSFWKSDLVDTTYKEMNDLIGESADYQITGIDPFIVYEIEPDIYEKAIVYFDEKAPDDIVINIFYSEKPNSFSEQKRISSVQKEGTDYTVFKLPNDRIQYIRVDYEGEGNIVIGDRFPIRSVYAVKDTLLTSLHSLMTTQTYRKWLWLTVIFIILFVAVYKQDKRWNQFYKNTRVRILLEILVICILPTILFWQYLSGQNCFIFSDVADDSIGQYYPYLLHLADRVQRGQWAEVFSFIVGIGNPEDPIIPNIHNWPAMFGRENVAYLMGASIFLKMVFSGLCAYGLVGLWGIRDEKRLILTLGYEFNAMLTIRSCWEAYPNVALMVIFWLYCFELAYRKRKKVHCLLFALSSELFFLQFSIYYCVFYGFLFMVYIFWRILSDGGSVKTALEYGFVYYGIFAFCGLVDSLLPSLITVFSSNRFISGYHSTVDDISGYFQFQWNVLYEAFIRSIGQAIGGVSADWIGMGNILKGPAFYFGISLLILIPVAYYNLPPKKKPLFLLGAFAAFLYIGFKGVRMLSTGMNDNTFRASSFWIPILGLLMLMEAFCAIKTNGFKKNSLLMFNISAGVCLALLLSLLFSDKIARMEQWWASLIYFLIYVVSINLIYVYRATVFRHIFVLTVITEGLVLSYAVLNDREVWTKEELKNLYYDDTYAAIHDIGELDDTWYRIEKYPASYGYCDSYAQDYYGTVSYIGGVGIGAAVQNYYEKLSLPYSVDWHVLYGTSGNLYANSLLGIKYIFLENMDNFRYGTKYVDSYANVDIYENTLALPIGYFYGTVIQNDEFETLSYWDRNKVLLEKCLIYDENTSFSENMEKNDPVFTGIASRHVFTSDEERIEVNKKNGNLIALDIHYKNGQSPSSGTFYWSDSSGKVNYQVWSPSGVLEIFTDDISAIWFDGETAKQIEYADLYTYDADKYYAETISSIETLQKNGLKVTDLSEYEICGTIKVPTDGIFATSIPYNENWEVYIDGVKADLLQVNTGFVGARMDAGDHMVRIYYAHESWINDNKFKCAGLGLIAIWGIYLLINQIRKKWKEDA